MTVGFHVPGLALPPSVSFAFRLSSISLNRRLCDGLWVAEELRVLFEKTRTEIVWVKK